MIEREECRWVRERLADRASGDISPAEAERVERHLGDCPECARALEHVAAVLDAARRIGPPPLPANFTDMVMARVALADRSRPRFVHRLRFLAAAVFLAAVAATLLLRGRPASPPRGNETAGVTTFVASLDGLADRAGRAGRETLALFAAASRQAAGTSRIEVGDLDVGTLSTAVEAGSDVLARDLEEASKVLDAILSEAGRSLPRL